MSSSQEGQTAADAAAPGLSTAATDGTIPLIQSLSTPFTLPNPPMLNCSYSCHILQVDGEAADSAAAAEAPADGDDLLVDLSLKKKKKKKKARADEFADGEDPEKAAEAEDEAAATNGKFSWSQTDREYTYDELLGRRCFLILQCLSGFLDICLLVLQMSAAEREAAATNGKSSWEGRQGVQR